MVAFIASCFFAFFMFWNWTEEHSLKFSMPAIGIPPLIISLMMLLWLFIVRLPFDPYFNLAIFLGCLGVMFGWLGIQAEEIYKSQLKKRTEERRKTIETRLAEYMKEYPNASENAVAQQRSVIESDLDYRQRF